jgi:hypothetical protein
MVKIENIKLQETSDGKELSALVDGSKVWFRFPKWLDIEARAEIFLPLALAEGMVRNEDVVIEGMPISEKLAGALPEIVKVFCSWNGEDNHPIKVHAETDATQQSSTSVICCFSGGIDSNFSLSQHSAEITHLLLVMGFDESVAGMQWQKLVMRMQSFADQHKKRLITVETNIREVIESRKLNWLAAHGNILSAIGTTLRVQSIIIPSSYTYRDLIPWGSHPLLDPLWNSETTSVIHDGIGFTRTQKTEQLLKYPDLLDDLQVCWKHFEKNCGHCSKCVRTTLALHMLKGSSANLPAYNGVASLSPLKPGSLSGIPYIDDLIHLAKRSDHGDIARCLIRYRNRFLFKYYLIESIRAIVGNRGRWITRRFAKKTWHNDRTKIESGRVTLD